MFYNRIVLIKNMDNFKEKYINARYFVYFPYTTLFVLDGAIFVEKYLMNALSLNYAPERV